MIDDRAELKRRIRAAMALADISSWDDLADKTPYGRTAIKDLTTPSADVLERHLRAIATACKLDFAWFEVPDLRHALIGQDPTAAERIEALEHQVRMLTRRHAAAIISAPDEGQTTVPPLAAAEAARKAREAAEARDQAHDESDEAQETKESKAGSSARHPRSRP